MIAVVIPAHNEEALLGDCLRSVLASARSPELHDERVLTIVVLDRCSDRTGEIARALGAEAIECDGGNVGSARATGAKLALDRGARWIATTDADTVVPIDWLSGQLAWGSEVFCGVVTVSDWSDYHPAMPAAFAGTEHVRDGHPHIHGANMGMSAAAYQAAGGYEALTVSEDVALVERFYACGISIARKPTPVVQTSPRRQSRAKGGFADYLATLESNLLQMPEPSAMGNKHHKSLATSTQSPMTKPAPPSIAMHDALFLDIDGCLLDFAATPNEVRVPEPLKDLLAYWLNALDGAVAVISGRELADIDALFQPLSLPAVGLHGLQARASVTGSHGAFEALRHVYTSAREYADSHPGVLIERKGAAMALHWRAAPHTEHALRQLAEGALQTLAGYRLQEGNGVVELLPIGPDKGDALAALMATQPFRGRRPIFAGDDVSDEPAMKMASVLGGYGVGVGPRTTHAAQYALSDPQAVAVWLAPSISFESQSNLMTAANAT